MTQLGEQVGFRGTELELMRCTNHVITGAHHLTSSGSLSSSFSSTPLDPSELRHEMGKVSSKQNEAHHL